MISFLGTTREVGIYAVAYALATQLNMLRNVNVMAFMPMFVKKFQNDGRMNGNRLIKLSLLLSLGIFAIAVLIYFFVEEIVILVFGSEYRESGNILAILIFYQVFFWATIPFGTALQSTHNEKISLYVNSFVAMLNIVLNFIFYYRFGLIGIAYSTLVVYFFFMLLTNVWTYILMKKQGYLS